MSKRRAPTADHLTFGECLVVIVAWLGAYSLELIIVLVLILAFLARPEAP